MSAGFVEPGTDAERILAAIWADLLHVERVGANDNFFELGGESILAVQMVARARDRGLSLTPKDLFLKQTVAELAALACAANTNESPMPHPLLVPMRTSGDGPPLFCIHPIEGTVFGYVPLVRILETHQPVYGIRAAGSESGETPATGVTEMAAEYVQAIRLAQPQGPYHLCGWSMGGLIAYEMARMLRRDGDEVAFLAILDQGPHAALWAKSQDAARFIERFDRLQAESGAAVEEWIAQLRQEPAVAQMLPDNLDEAAVNRHLLVYLRNWHALGNYAPASSREHIHLFRTEAAPMDDLDETLGWGGVARGGVEVHIVPGDHHSMMRFPHVAALAQALRASLTAILHPHEESVAM